MLPSEGLSLIKGLRGSDLDADGSFCSAASHTFLPSGNYKTAFPGEGIAVLCFSVGGRMFLLLSAGHGDPRPPSMTAPVGDSECQAFIGHQGFLHSV